MVILKNERIELNIAEVGAELRRATLDGVDMLWSGDPQYWQGVAPVLFPVCGGLRDDKFIFEGEEYEMPKHGFGRFLEYSVEKSSKYSVTMLATDTPDTLKNFPWKFEFRITYTLRGATLEVSYDVKNVSDKKMYFSVGSHEAYACPEGIEDYDIVFPQNETLNAYVLDGTLLTPNSETVLKDSNVLPLYTKYFEIDALVFKNLKSRSAKLRNRKTGRTVTVEFPGRDYLLLWTKPGAGYICIEPWCGIPGTVGDDYEIEKKEGIKSVEAGCTFTSTHTIHFE